jgi:hypothetical protein
MPLSIKRTLLALLLLLLGFFAWFTLGAAKTGGTPAIVSLAIAIVVGLLLQLRPARSATDKILTTLENPTPRARAIIATAFGFTAGGYLLITANAQGRMFGPVLHDEHCYLIQARMLAHGRLWMPPHELADHFDSFHLITDRVYAAKYGPGTALFLAPAAIAGADLWIVPLLLSAVCVAMLYLVVTEMLDGLAGILAAIMLLAVGEFRRLSIGTVSQIPMLLLLLLALWAFLHWRKTKSVGWIALIGVAVGWGAITRPADTACLALPLVIGIALGLRGAPARRWAITITVGFAATAPFLALQLVANKGITGHWLELPWTYYADRYDPYDSTSLAPYDPARHTHSIVPQIQVFEREIIVPGYKAKLAMGATGRLSMVSRAVAQIALPNPLLLILATMGLACSFSRSRWIPLTMILAFVLFHARYTSFITYYLVTLAPGMILLALLGWRAAAAVLPDAPSRALTVFGALAILALAIAALPQISGGAGDEWPNAGPLRLIDGRLGAEVRPPAVVLFEFDPVNNNPIIEPVYNVDTAWPDDAPVIRAHDLGEAQNRKLFAYYAKHNPNRAIYRYRRNQDVPNGKPLTYLGTARDLAAH